MGLHDPYPNFFGVLGLDRVIVRIKNVDFKFSFPLIKDHL